MDIQIVLRMVICIITLDADCTVAVDNRPQLIAEKENETLQFNCSTSKEPIGPSVEILINGKTLFNLHFNGDECYRKTKKCGFHDCSCSNGWFHWQQNATSGPMTVECHMRYNDDPGTDVSADIFYNGSDFINLSTTTSTELLTENPTNTTESPKVNSSKVPGIVVGVCVGLLLIIIILIGFCVWKCKCSVTQANQNENEDAPMDSYEASSAEPYLDFLLSGNNVEDPTANPHIELDEIGIQSSPEHYLLPLLICENNTGKQNANEEDIESFHSALYQLDNIPEDTVAGDLSQLENTPEETG